MPYSVNITRCQRILPSEIVMRHCCICLLSICCRNTDTSDSNPCNTKPRVQPPTRHASSASPPPHTLHTQNLQLLGYLGKGITSLMFSMPVANCTRRSKPRPKPACGTEP
jgi:hypothetical protein